MPEYASIRLRSRCAMATAFPITIDRIDSAAIIFIQAACCSSGVIAAKRRMTATSVAAFGATESHPATGDGAPW